MKAVGIVCEYNPFHNGHARQISLLRERGYDRILCLMSGNFVQRAEPAILPAYPRASCALRAGADLVLELPFPFSASASDFFAGAAISVFSRLGVNVISFGSESGDADTLFRTAQITADPSFEERLRVLRARHPETGGAALRERALREAGAERLPAGQNDLLGVAYLSAAIRKGVPVAPEILLRDGCGYSEEELIPGLSPSATALRKALSGREPEELPEYLPKSVLAVLSDAKAKGEFPVTPEGFFDRLLPFFRLANGKDLSGYAENSGGLAARLVRTAQESSSFGEWLSRAATKKYTAAHLRRAILFAATKVFFSDLSGEPEYTTLLGANATGRVWLSELRRQVPGFIVTKAADAPACRQTELGRAADALYALSLPIPREAGVFMKNAPIIL